MFKHIKKEVPPEEGTSFFVVLAGLSERESPLMDVTCAPRDTHGFYSERIDAIGCEEFLMDENHPLLNAAKF